MFSTKEFIDASRDFVCIRIETYENEQSEEIVRALLIGRFANTAFGMFDPYGKHRLSRTGRSPGQVLARSGSDENDEVIEAMKDIASRYRRRGQGTGAVLQDFLSFEQALNVASADQRLLVFVDADEAEIAKLSPTLKEVFGDEEIIGRFHLDFAGKEDLKWQKSIKGATSTPAINIIRSGKYGLDGSIEEHLPLTATSDEIKTTLLNENKRFKSTEQRKEYAAHVMAGKRAGIKYESAIPYGEDRDADGETDQRPGRKGKGKGKRREGRPMRGR